MVEKTKKKEKTFIAQNIILRRKALGWNQSILAEKASVGLNTIKSIERGRSSGWPGTKEAIARALGCTPDELHINPSFQPIDFKAHPEAKKIAEEIVKELRGQDAINLTTSMPRPESLEIVRLKKENDELKAKIASIPKQVLKHWDGLEDLEQALCLYILTKKTRFFDFLPQETRSKILRVFRTLHLEEPKDRA